MTFEGFVPPTKNYFPMPNEWIDICSQIKSLAEIKVIFYILRHTWGYHEYGITKVISFDEFRIGRKRNDGTRMDSGTGLSRQSVIDGLSLAVKHGYIICEIDATDLARVKKSYALKMRSGVKNLDPQISSLNSIPLGSNIYTSEVKEVDSSGLNSTPRSEKDTIERHLEKDTLERQEDASASTHTQSENVIDFKKASDGRLKAISSSHSQMDIRNGDEAIYDTPTREMPIVQKPGAGTRLSPADIPPGVSTGDATSVQAPSSNAGTPAQHSGISPGTSTSAGAAQVKPTPKSDTREIQRRINEHRGYALEEKVEIVRERTAVKSWCNLHTIEDYEQVMLKLKSDPYWKKPENYYRIGGLTLAKETPKALAPAQPSREQDDNCISFDDYVGNGPEARALVLIEAEERMRNGTLAM